MMQNSILFIRIIFPQTIEKKLAHASMQWSTKVDS